MKKLSTLLIFIFTLALLAGCANVKKNTDETTMPVAETKTTTEYKTDRFSFEYPANWKLEKRKHSDVLIGNDSNNEPDLQLQRADAWSPTGLKQGETETFVSEQNIEWTFVHFTKDMDWRDYDGSSDESISDDAHLISITGNENSEGVPEFAFFYSYEDSVNLNAEEQLKDILNTFKVIEN